jgi:cell division inhibitor SepF
LSTPVPGEALRCGREDMMAASFMKRTMAYLGLVDDEYDDYDDYDARGTRAVSRVSAPPMPTEEVDDVHYGARPGRIRTLTREDSAGPSPGPVAQQASIGARRATVRPISPEAAGAKVHIVAPARFADAQEIANRLMDTQPVIVNLQNADRDLQRRMIDFCSGVTYALSGGMERVADEVFLLTPSNVKVSDEERQRLAERGLVNP